VPLLKIILLARQFLSLTVFKKQCLLRSGKHLGWKKEGKAAKSLKIIYANCSTGNLFYDA
jgi:hypothetical protein